MYVALPLAVGAMDVLPDPTCAPLQPPLAVHDTAAVDDHVNVELWPSVMLAGATAMVTAGPAGALGALPPPPPQAVARSPLSAAPAARHVRRS